MTSSSFASASTGSLGLALTLATAAPGVAAEQHVGPYGAPWCETLASLKPYIEGIMARDTAALEALQDCAWLKAGVRIEILKDYLSFGQPSHVVKVRVYGNGTSVDGYMMSHNVDTP